MARKKDGFKLALSEQGLNRALVKSVSHTIRSRAEEVAGKVAEQVGDGITVDVIEGVTHRGRPYSLVTIVHPSGLGIEAKRGILAGAAVSSGMDISRYEL